ncbi:MAG: SiaB family protein kinase [Bacteroidales bacterium]|nr:SiaB family protein kinase [Bacteroidales bacterium]
MQNNSQIERILQFRGDLNYDIIGELIGLLKDRMKQREARYGLYKKLLTLLIESLENIVRYNIEISSQEKHIKKNPPELLVSCSREYFTLSTSNLIRNEDIHGLRERITTLNNLDKEALKDLYKETITDGKFSEKGGAGLGLIEMAKIIDQPIGFAFTRLNDKFSVYKLELYIRNDNGKPT